MPDVVPYAQFGSSDVNVYSAYLVAYMLDRRPAECSVDSLGSLVEGVGGYGVGAFKALVAGGATDGDGGHGGAVPRLVGERVIHGGSGGGGIGDGACAARGAVAASGDGGRCVDVHVEGHGGTSGGGSGGDAVGSGGDGLGPVVRGRWYKKNKNKRDNRRRAAGGAVVSSGVDCDGLRDSLRAKWLAQNRLEEEKAKQQWELLCARDVDKVKRMQAAQVMRATEMAKVQTEKAFASLAKSGNVSGVRTVVSDDGTVLGSEAVPGLTRSDGSGISPDSSVSQQEIREMQKALLDAQKKLEYYEAASPALAAEFEKRSGVKTAFTLDSDGDVPIADPGYMKDGKYHTYDLVESPDWTPHSMKLAAKDGFDEFDS